MLVASRMVSPMIVPKSWKAMGDKPGQRSFWDASVAAFFNGVINSLLVLRAWRREPQLFYGTDDAYFSTQDSCDLLVVFMSWILFDTANLVWHRNVWDGQLAMSVHHVTAFIAWALYFEGGYGHSLSLVGVFCEVTNPFMNLRYLLAACGMKDSKTYLYNGIAFCLSWIAVRLAYAIPMGAYLISLHWVPLRAALPTWRLALYVIFYGVGGTLNCMWGYKLLTGAIKLIKTGSHAKGT